MVSNVWAFPIWEGDVHCNDWDRFVSTKIFQHFLVYFMQGFDRICTVSSPLILWHWNLLIYILCQSYVDQLMYIGYFLSIVCVEKSLQVFFL